MGFIDTIKRAVSIGGSSKVAKLAPRSEYMRGGRTVTFAQWRPALREANTDVANGWSDAAARTIDLIHNNGWIAGIIEQSVANTVGTGLRLKPAPENSLFGMNDASARQWAKEVGRRFEAWSMSAIECDIEGKSNLGALQAKAFKSWLAMGEIFYELPWRRRLGNGTKVRLMPPYRLSRTNDLGRNIVLGVRTDNDGLPTGYLVKRKTRYVGEEEVMLPSRDAMWRPRTGLIYDGMVNQQRGITPFVAALQVARQFDQLSDATLMAAIVQSVFAATIKSEQPTEELLAGLLTPQEQTKAVQAGLSNFDAWFQAQQGWYDSASINVGVNGRIAHLFPGQEMQFHGAEHPNSNYRDFAIHLLREIARCAGLTYESASGDWEGATYASTKLATTEIFAVTLYRRQNIMAPFVNAIYEAWLEAEIEEGGVQFPGGIEAFYANRPAARRALWRGSPKPQADDLKIAKAHEVWRGMGVMTDEMICNDLGVDVDDVYDQRKAEMDMRKERGLPEAVASDRGIASGAGDPNDPNDPNDNRLEV